MRLYLALLSQFLQAGKYNKKLYSMRVHAYSTIIFTKLAGIRNSQKYRSVKKPGHTVNYVPLSYLVVCLCVNNIVSLSRILQPDKHKQLYSMRAHVYSRM